MSNIKSPEQWRSIFADQQSSDLTITNYCQQHQLSTSNFYAKRKALATTSSFIQATITQKIEMTPKTEPFVLTVGKIQLTLPSQTCAHYLAQVIRGIHA